jgi:chromosome segregation ATPase
MSEQTGLLSRITSLFGRRSRVDVDLNRDRLPLDPADLQAAQQLIEPRGSIFRPFHKRDVALQSLSESFVSLTRLMSAIREGLERQQDRQDELIRLLGSLPAVIEAIPESNRAQAEAMRGIYQQLAAQNNAQSTLGEVLNRIVDGNGEQRKLIDALHDQLDGLRQTDASISDNLASVGNAMQTLGSNSHTSAQVLQQVQDGLRQRDEAMQAAIERQNQRFNFILWLSVVLAITTVLSLVMVTYVAMRP